MQPWPKIEKLENLTSIELMLISQKIPFMFIVANSKRAQFGLKGQCVSAPADFQKIQTVPSRPCDEKCLVSLVLKRYLTDRSTVCQQHIQPSAVKVLWL